MWMMIGKVNNLWWVYWFVFVDLYLFIYLFFWVAIGEEMVSSTSTAEGAAGILDSDWDSLYFVGVHLLLTLLVMLYATFVVGYVLVLWVCSGHFFG